MKKNGKFVLVLAIVMIAMCGTAAAELPPMYAGVDLGYGASFPDFGGNLFPTATGFEMTPYFGINPIKSVQDLSFEFDLQMDFLKYYSRGSTDVMRWRKSDAESYLKAIKEMLDKYIGEDGDE